MAAYSILDQLEMKTDDNQVMNNSHLLPTQHIPKDKKKVSFCDHVTVTLIPKEPSSTVSLYRFVCNKMSNGCVRIGKAVMSLDENSTINSKLSGGSNSPQGSKQKKTNWQSNDCIEIRNNMVLRIENILRKRHDADESWLKNISKIALALERKIYIEASTYEEYTDPESVFSRLTDTVNEMQVAQAAIAMSTTSKKRRTSSPQTNIESPKRIRSSEDDSNHLLKRQRQRLLWLHHASKCYSGNDKCLNKKLCEEMRSLWTHIHSCKDDNCRTMNCLSSRSALSHYAHCKNDTCDVCMPVHKIIQKK